MAQSHIALFNKQRELGKRSSNYYERAHLKRRAIGSRTILLANLTERDRAREKNLQSALARGIILFALLGESDFII